MNAVKFFIEKGQIVKDESAVVLSKKYFDKAKRNFETMNILSDINSNIRARKLLKISKNYNSDEWIVISGYYAMYSAALALIAKIGYKSKNHSATIALLEEFFIKKKLMSQEDINLLINAVFRKEELDKLSEARHKREIAQYSVTKQTTKDIAESIKKDAYSFISKVESVIQ
jgi:uncharacterized protein (UPF0332 family)